MFGCIRYEIIHKIRGMCIGNVVVLVSFDLSNPRNDSNCSSSILDSRAGTRKRCSSVPEVTGTRGHSPRCPLVPFLFQRTASGPPPHPSCPWSRLDASRVALGLTEEAELGREAECESNLCPVFSIKFVIGELSMIIYGLFFKYRFILLFLLVY